MRDTIKIEPGCLDDIPGRQLAIALASLGLELVCKPDGLRIRKARQPTDYVQPRANLEALGGEHA